MKAVVKKWGNSASVRIPAAVLQAAKLRLDDSVDVREESGRIVIEPVPRREYTLSELLKGITPENLHEGVDFGRPVRKEAWRCRLPTCPMHATLCGSTSTRKPGMHGRETSPPARSARRPTQRRESSTCASP